MIVVTEATGHLGHLIVENLIKRIPANEVGVSVRDPAKAADFQALGVRVRQGDFDEPDSLKYTFEGAAQVLIVSSNARASGGDPLAQHRSAIEAARAAGVKRIVYTSHMAVSHSSAFPPMRDHAATEEMLSGSGLAWTALRDGFYAASGVAMMGDAPKTGVLESPADGKVSWTAHADLGEAAAIILINDGRYDGPTLPLTGSQLLDFADLAAIASTLLGKPVQRKTVEDEYLLAKMKSRGAPASAADIALGFFIASRNGEFSSIDSTLEQLLGRPPATIQEVMAQKFKV
jgi:NAD(P)H dehydrogenase (quinone)